MSAQEQWKDIIGYEGLYQVSTNGRVKNLRRNRILNGNIKRNGYVRVCLHHSDGSLWDITIHRLVGFAFLPNPENKPQINHIDRNKTNNMLDNLEWVTSQENVIHSVLTGRPSCAKKVQQLDMDEKLIKVWNSITEAGKEGFNQAGISSVCSGRYKHHRGFKWKYN